MTDAAQALRARLIRNATRDGNAYGFARMHREKDDLDYWDGEP